MQANIEDVAQRSGVSIATVSRTFKHPELVAEKTRHRVLATAKELNFSISRSASIFQTGQTFRVALLINDRSSSWFNAHIYEGLNSVLQPAGYDIVFYQIDSAKDRHEFFETLPIRRNVDAVIVSSFDIERSEAERLNAMNVPVAGINAMPHEAFGVSICINDETSMRLMTRHLTSLGHTDIAFVTFCETQNGENALHFSANLRAKGFTEGCEDAGIQPIVISVNENENPVDDALTQLFALGHMPTAICCVQDSLALPILSRLQGFGYKVPQNISVTGFDDMELAGQTGLTCVHQDPVAMGAETGRLVLDAVCGKLNSPVRKEVEPKVIFRSSSSSAPQPSNVR